MLFKLFLHVYTVKLVVVKHRFPACCPLQLTSLVFTCPSHLEAASCADSIYFCQVSPCSLVMVLLWVTGHTVTASV